MAVTRRDLRPLPAVTIELAGAVQLEALTNEHGRAAFLGLPPAGVVTVTPARSGFRFEPPQLTILDAGNPPAVAFTALPTLTDLALTIATENEAPLVGEVFAGTITLRNLGAEAATDIAVGFGSLPGLVLEHRQAEQGRLETRVYDTLWRLSQLDPGASAEVQYRCRATLPETSVLAVALLEEMDQTDTDPLNNSAQVIVRTRRAPTRVRLALTMDPATAKVGERLPVRLMVRNEGPNDATGIAIRSYCPPGASLLPSLDPLHLGDDRVPRPQRWTRPGSRHSREL